MIEGLVVPSEIEDVLRRFDASEAGFDLHDLEQALREARKALKESTESEDLGAWAELLAFGLSADQATQSPWDTYFGPMGSGVTADGKTVYFPDVENTPPVVVLHWAERARTATHPILKSRYADLAWDMAPLIGNMRRDPDMARGAIDAYLDGLSPKIGLELHNQFETALRAFDLSGLINDAVRRERARGALMDLHRKVMKDKQGHWWHTFERLMGDKSSGVTDEEKQELVNDFEALLTYYSDTSTPEKFNPHFTREVANLLIKHYARHNQPDHVKRLHEVVARTFEHFASLGNAMLASTFLQTATDSFRDAGMQEESRRTRILMQEKIGEARSEMVPISGQVEISKDDIETFVAAVVTDDLGSTFVRIATEFLPARRMLEEQAKATLKHAPLMAHIKQTIMADDHVAAVIGSVGEDPLGRLFLEIKFSFGFSALWLQQAFDRMLEKHEVVPEHVVSWANRHGLFDDMSLLLEGVRAWVAGDLVKAVHVLVPQVEHALRSIAGQLGRPVTKAHAKVPGVSISIGMGDILYSDEIAEALGPDLTLYFLALYADPRGLNLRNEVAHGLLGTSAIGDHLGRLLIHTLLVLGVWNELAKKRR
jgi:lysyl-tRNA synthetase class 1